MKIIGIFFIIITSIFFSCTNKSKSNVPKFISKQFNGDTVNLQDLAKNKVTFIIIWTTFCDNCLIEISNLHDLYTKYKDNKNITFVTIAFNTSEELKQFTTSRDTLNPYQEYFKNLKSETFEMPILVGAKLGYEIYLRDDGSFIPGIRDTSEVNKLYRLFNFQGLPTTIIFNADGQLVYKYSGPKSMRENISDYKSFLDKKLDSLLNL
jgi:thiol-disulfide isomerase/thioredoxin